MNKSDTIAIIRSLLSSTNSPYSIHNLNVDFKNETGVDIPLFGYNNISDFLQSITDTVKVTGVYPIQKVSLVSNEKSAHIVSLVQRQRITGQKKKFSTRNDFGSRKFEANFRSQEVQEQRQRENYREKTERKAISDNNKELKEVKNDVSSFKTEFLKNGNDLSSPNYNYEHVDLQNYVELGECIPSIDMRCHAQVGEYVEVCPSRILSPHKFYFTFRKFKTKFSAFSKELQIFYNSHDKVPSIHEEAIKPKLICAALFKTNNKSMWHRVEILEVSKDTKKVLVNFIDTGDTATVSQKYLKYLHKDFTSFPRQACLGSLANIKPSKGNLDWSLNAIKRFSKLSFQKELVAGVVHIDSTGLHMNMTLSRTTGVEIHINDTLVAEGYAEFNTDVLNCQVVDSLKNYNPSTAKWSFSEDDIEYHSNNVMESSSSEYRTSVFYLSSNYCSNKKLKKMFTLVDKT